MHQKRICCPGGSEAIRYAGVYLSELGFEVLTAPDLGAAHLLLPVPSFPASDAFLESALAGLSQDVCISGGNLDGRLE